LREAFRFAIEKKMNLISSQFLDVVHAFQGEFSGAAPLAFGLFITMTIITIPGLLGALRQIGKSSLRFTTYERDTIWFAAMKDQRYLVSLKAAWAPVSDAARDAHG
jgi:hypothetical protein